MSRSPFSFGTKILAGGAALLLTVLGIGVVMPADWEAEATLAISARPDAVLEYLDSPAGWTQWTPWPDSSTTSGPERGAGATLSWDDREFGSGTFTIVAVEARTRVRYRVEVNGGKMWTDGTIEIAPEGTGTRVTWRESGDLGRNPLMGFWALSMDRAQAEELQKSLDRLAALVAETETGADPGENPSGA